MRRTVLCSPSYWNGSSSLFVFTRMANQIKSIASFVTRSCENVEHMYECRFTEALERAQNIGLHGRAVTRDDIYCLLQGCQRWKDLNHVRQVQYLMTIYELSSVPVLGDHLIRLFTDCQCLPEANAAFDKIVKPSEYTWSAIISANAKIGQGQFAFKLHHIMKQSGMISGKYVSIGILTACKMTSSLLHGRLIYNEIISIGLLLDVVVASSLIDMYVKCGSLDEAYIVFDKSSERDAVLWGVMIAGYVQQDEGLTALECFEKMQQEGTKPTNVIFLSILKACASVGAIEQGRLIHDQVVKSEFHFDVFVENTLIDMYAKCGSLKEAHSIFSKSPIRNVVSWNAMITGYTQHCDCSSALEFFEIMQREGIKPTTITFLSVLKACAFIGEIVQGRLLHGHIIQKKYESDETLENTLLDMYAKCGSLEEACRIFERQKGSNIVARNAMISGYAEHGQGLHAIEVFWTTQEAGIMSNNVTYLGVLKSCSTIGMIQMGRLIHEEAVENGLESDIAIGSALIDMYSKCGSLMESKLVFDKLPARNVVCWGAMISAYALSEGHLALKCYEMMLQIGIKPARATFLSILKACSNVGAIQHGRLVHEQIIQSGLQVDIAIGNTLIDMYAKCGSLGDSANIFNEMENRNIVSWSVMIAAYAQDEEGLAALECFERMQLEGVEPNDVTFLSLLKACASVGAVGQARLIHEKIIKSGLQLDVFMENAIVDMHAKCGDMNAACKFFDELAYKTLVSWNAMIVGYAQHGDGHLALECFERMQKECIKPNEVSFTSIFLACSHVGLVDEGLWYFKFMAECCGIIPASSHYTSMVDLLGGSGYFDEAEKLMQASFQPNVLGWVSLLNACKIYGNTECGKHCFDQIVVSNSSQMAAYILMSNLYADAHMEDGYRVDELRKCIRAE